IVFRILITSSLLLCCRLLALSGAGCCGIIFTPAVSLSRDAGEILTTYKKELNLMISKDELVQFFEDAKKSRTLHTIEDRITALEIMTCAIAASLKGESRENFLTIMNSFSLTNNPMKNRTDKSVADLHVLSANFVTILNSLK
ncbi:hypothetical protein, partial [Xenorhabdus thuongxuanensis]